MTGNKWSYLQKEMTPHKMEIMLNEKHKMNNSTQYNKNNYTTSSYFFTHNLKLE